MVLALGDVSRPPAPSHDLTLVCRQAGVTRVLEDIDHPLAVPRPWLAASTKRPGLPSGVVQCACDRPRPFAAHRQTKNHRDRWAAVLVNHETLGHDTGGAYVDREAVPVRPDPKVIASFHGTSLASRDSQRTSAGVLVIALAGNDGVQEIAERVRVLDGSYADVAL